MISVSNLLDKVSDFDSLTQREQVKLLSYFYCISNNIEEFTSSQIKKCFEQRRGKTSDGARKKYPWCELEYFSIQAIWS